MEKMEGVAWMSGKNGGGRMVVKRFHDRFEVGVLMEAVVAGKRWKRFEGG